MNVVIYHSYLAPDAPLDELDVLDEVAFYKENLESAGYTVFCKAFPFDFRELLADKEELKPVFIVNLVETIYNDGRLIHVAPAFFDFMGVPYTGCPSESVYLTSNKLTTKLVLKAHNIKAPAYVCRNNIAESFNPDFNYLVKSVWEHASVGLDESTLRLLNLKDDIESVIKNASAKGKEVFAEQFIEGREFNIAVLGGEKGPQVLHPAEIKFVDFPEGKLKIVGYRAKWIEDSFEYKNTIRSFDFVPEDAPLLEELKQICLKCWNVFNLKGYARVDFRVDKNGIPYVLEINTNPCISPDSGFIAAVKKTNIGFEELFQRIIYDTFQTY
ncbi:MAG: ATP-grasp domain-containing protein [Bacteroidales bacterium]|nr:ATP-grasp domain-containing protein [Bacteroidales bacterium]